MMLRVGDVLLPSTRGFVPKRLLIWRRISRLRGCRHVQRLRLQW